MIDGNRHRQTLAGFGSLYIINQRVARDLNPWLHEPSPLRGLDN